MDTYETIVLLISLLAVFISFVSLIRTRNISHQQIELEKKTAELAEKQLEIINKKEKETSFAKIDVNLEENDNDHRLVITNIGGAEAKDVHLSIDGKGYPLDASEYAEKIPILFLSPSKSVKLRAARTLDCGSKYEINVHWLNPDNSQGRNKMFVHY